MDSELCAIWPYPAFKQLRPGVNSLVWLYIGSTAFRWFVWLSIYVVCMRKLFFWLAWLVILLKSFSNVEKSCNGCFEDLFRTVGEVICSENITTSI